MKLQKDLEKAITKAKKYEKAQEVAEKIMTHTQPGVQHDKIWTEWERSLLTALVLHCAHNKDKTPALERIQQLVAAPESGQKTIGERLSKPEEKEALGRFEQSLELTPVSRMTDKAMSVRANRWSGTVAGLSSRIGRLLNDAT